MLRKLYISAKAPRIGAQDTRNAAMSIDNPPLRLQKIGILMCRAQCPNTWTILKSENKMFNQNTGVNRPKRNI
jgi:hypothetical protein